MEIKTDIYLKVLKDEINRLQLENLEMRALLVQHEVLKQENHVEEEIEIKV